MTGTDVVVWYNPRCSKCRGAEELLASYGIPAQKMLYLDNPPGRAEIARVLALLGTEDPRMLGPGGHRAAPELLLPLLEAGCNPDG